MAEFGDRARLIHARNNWMIGVYKRARDAMVQPEAFPEFLKALEVGELFGKAMRNRLTRIPSDLFERNYSTEQLHKFLTNLLKDKKRG